MLPKTKEEAILQIVEIEELIYTNTELRKQSERATEKSILKGKLLMLLRSLFASEHGIQLDPENVGGEEI